MSIALQFGVQRKGSGQSSYLHKRKSRGNLNLQSKGGMAKPYQVKQIRNVILKYKMGAKISD